MLSVVHCDNDAIYTYDSGELCKHLLAIGFMPGYTTWTGHGEDRMSYEEAGHEEEWMMDGDGEVPRWKGAPCGQAPPFMELCLLPPFMPPSPFLLL